MVIINIVTLPDAYKVGLDPINFGDIYLLGRKAPPSQYLVKIKSFSLLWDASVEKYESEEFESGGYKWYPSFLLSIFLLHIYKLKLTIL